MRRVLAVIAACVVAYVAITVFLVYQDMGMRNKISSVLSPAVLYRDQVEAAVREGRPPPPQPAKLGPYTRALYARPDGSVVIEVADDLVPGGSIFFTPARTAKGIEWKCSAQRIPPKYLPGTCRD